MSMKQRTILPISLRRLLFSIGVFFIAACLAACSAADNDQKPSLSDIFASDVAVIYDGRPHFITISNTIKTDTVLYSVDNVTFSTENPVFVMPDTYTVYYAVCRSGYTPFYSSATVTIAKSILSDISAEDRVLVFDGQAHSQPLSDIDPTLTAEYSTDGSAFSEEAPAFTAVGEYTVYYHVFSSTAEYRASYKVTILPDIYGVYFDTDGGVIELSHDTATVNGVAGALSFNCTGTGLIGENPFTVRDGVLYYANRKYTLLPPSQYIYKLSTLDKSVYFCGDDNTSVKIDFDQNGAKIVHGSRVILTIPHVNYCDLMSVQDHFNGFYNMNIRAEGTITEVDVPLSTRLPTPATSTTEYFVYDGNNHSLSLNGAMFVADGSLTSACPSFTDIGKHAVDAVFTADGCLPAEVRCYVVILPDIVGVYIDTNTVINITRDNVIINGDAVPLEITDDTWSANGEYISLRDDGIVWNGKKYSKTESNAIVLNILGNIRILTESIGNITVTVENNILNVAADGVTLYSGNIDGKINVSADGDPVESAPIPQGYMFVVGLDELSQQVSVVRIINAR